MLLFFFFSSRRRHTRCSRDWSSDVCSSDLECTEHLYEFLDKELTPEVEREIRVHLKDCPPCGEHFDFERLFLDFLQARCRARGAPPDLKRRILRELFDE